MHHARASVFTIDCSGGSPREESVQWRYVADKRVPVSTMSYIFTFSLIVTVKLHLMAHWIYLSCASFPFCHQNSANARIPRALDPSTRLTINLTRDSIQLFLSVVLRLSQDWATISQLDQKDFLYTGHTRDFCLHKLCTFVRVIACILGEFLYNDSKI